MPTVLLLSGWRLFFYAGEGNEPIHIHCRKGDMECKYWLHSEEFEISEALYVQHEQRGQTGDQEDHL
jgi:hypothetical protein